jgi:hypothetical protein
MRTSETDRSGTEAEILAFMPALKRRQDREQFFRLHGEWVNPYRDGIDGLWVGPMVAQIIPLASQRLVAAGR